MASEYLKWKYRDVKPAEKKEYTKEELRRNWWHYNKWNVIFGCIGVCFLVYLVLNAFGVFTVKPDITVAVVTKTPLADEDLQQLQEHFSTLIDDINNDKKKTAEINVYVQTEDPASEQALYSGYASEITLVSDLESRKSFLFLLEDPDTFQHSFEILARLDGSLPQDFTNADGCCIPVRDIPALQSLDGIQDLYLARRGFWTEKTIPNYDQCVSFLETLLKGD